MLHPILQALSSGNHPTVIQAIKEISELTLSTAPEHMLRRVEAIDAGVIPLLVALLKPQKPDEVLDAAAEALLILVEDGDGPINEIRLVGGVEAVEVLMTPRTAAGRHTML